MNKDFRTYREACEYAVEMKAIGFIARVEEFYDFDGQFFCVMVWE